MSTANELNDTTAGPVWLDKLRWPKHYGLLIFVSCLDILCTWVILAMGGSEVNRLADAVLGTFGFNGMVVYKFALVTLVIVLCEEVTRRRPPTGNKLAVGAIGISVVPVMFGTGQLLSTVLYGV